MLALKDFDYRFEECFVVFEALLFFNTQLDLEHKAFNSRLEESILVSKALLCLVIRLDLLFKKGNVSFEASFFTVKDFDSSLEACLVLFEASFLVSMPLNALVSNPS